jgi:hypothetical protein
MNAPVDFQEKEIYGNKYNSIMNFYQEKSV